MRFFTGVHAGKIETDPRTASRKVYLYMSEYINKYAPYRYHSEFEIIIETHSVVCRQFST